ncbi:uncharacterized protein LOC107041154 isoform X2 [Diachasma alloeum]|uniref:uncharacterized protein LOC107041154 isoform X2 n=1 Tax=Diachasma alloeum TaxID=454923 RepID=UPI0007384025|nr:uncharacterized protein LOC107041154 isoform X2 [Diachasma alloeum]
MRSIKELSFSTVVSLIVLVALMPEFTYARPAAVTMGRHKRTSDQRLAELETLIALENLRGKLVTVPVGFGKVDPAKIGRRRRSSVEFDLQRLRRFLQVLGSQSESNSEESSEEIFPSLLNEDQRDEDLGNQLI